ncbi:uncharacterized protein LOC142486231 [Ascaphus truei]|uniref:uncharacterized protein LOC142486231 n=1 Tax=Ascaphus truei TaxID=8439 RepID=UPI003F5A2255
MSQGSSYLPCLNPQGPTPSSAGSEPKAMTVRGGSCDIRAGPSGTERALKMKRKKSKKERNHARFSNPQAKRVLGQGSHGSFPPKCPPPSCARAIPPSALRGACNSNPVIITQSRLTQHLGIFNREVKSADIGRLLSTGAQAQDPRSKSQSQGGSTGPGDVTPTPGTEPQGQGEEPAPNITQADQKGTSSSQPSSTLPASGADISPPQRHTAPVPEAALAILHMLRSQPPFPGRSLLSETQQAITANVLLQHGTMPNLSALSVRRKLDYSSKVGADACEDMDQRHSNIEGTGSRKTGHRSERERNLKQRFPLQFLSSPEARPVHTGIKSAKNPQGQREVTDPFNKLCGPEYNLARCPQRHQRSHQHRPRLTAGEDHSSLRDHPELVWDPRSRLERTTEAFRQAMRQNQTDNLSAADCGPGLGWKRAHDECQTSQTCTHYGHQHNARHTISPKQWVLSERKPPVNYQSYPLQEMFPGQVTQAGHRHRAGENQTSFDVLSSIWSCNTHKSPGSKISVHQSHCLNVSPQEAMPCYRELSAQREHSKGSLQNYPSYYPSFPPGEGFQDVADASHVESLELRDVKTVQRQRAQSFGSETIFHHAVLPPTSSRWKGVHEHNHGALWSPISALTRDPVPTGGMENLWGKGWHSNKDWSCVAVHSDLHGHRGQLPISMFPPSESLDLEDSFHTLPSGGSYRRTLLNRSSPDTWVFPRMKLY